MKKNSNTHWLDNITTITTQGLLPGQDRLFIKQIKKPARYGYLLLDELNSHKLIVHTLNKEAIEYNTVEEIEAEGWVVD